jgi:hypothetical protein
VVWQQTNLDDDSKLLTALLLADQKIANTSCNSFASGRPKDCQYILQQLCFWQTKRLLIHSAITLFTDSVAMSLTDMQ